MLHSTRALRKYEVHATDGKLGVAVDAYFDNDNRQLQYLVVETGRWLPGKKLLIGQRFLGLPDRDKRQWPINMTREEAERRQAAVEELPTSWELEELLKARYGGLDNRGGAPLGAMHGSASRQAIDRAVESRVDQVDLRSLAEVVGYHIEALDGPLGVAEDFLIDDEDWGIRYMVVDTKSWKPGREVLVPPEWVETVSWGERKIHVKISRQKVKTSQRVDRASHAVD
jgi:hypothetical protein